VRRIAVMVARPFSDEFQIAMEQLGVAAGVSWGLFSKHIWT
jgi:hypothetical protein